jgi:hypothetical protein
MFSFQTDQPADVVDRDEHRRRWPTFGRQSSDRDLVTFFTNAPLFLSNDVVLSTARNFAPPPRRSKNNPSRQ